MDYVWQVAGGAGLVVACLALWGASARRAENETKFQVVLTELNLLHELQTTRAGQISVMERRCESLESRCASLTDQLFEYQTGTSSALVRLDHLEEGLRTVNPAAWEKALPEVLRTPTGHRADVRNIKHEYRGTDVRGWPE